MTSTATWMDPETAAAELAVPVEAIREAIRTKAIPSLQIGDYVRISREALHQIALGTVTVPTQSVPHSSFDLGLSTINSGMPLPARLRWEGELEKIDEFEFAWPQSKKDYGSGDNVEQYPVAYEGKIVLANERFSAKVGVGTRGDRGRMTVFFNNSPICEFVETTDSEGWASIVKPDGKHVLFPGDEVPLVYSRSRLELYREVTGLSGIGVPKGLALVIAADDYRSAVHHASARWLGRRGYLLTRGK